VVYIQFIICSQIDLRLPGHSALPSNRICIANTEVTVERTPVTRPCRGDRRLGELGWNGRDWVTNARIPKALVTVCHVLYSHNAFVTRLCSIANRYTSPQHMFIATDMTGTAEPRCSGGQLTPHFQTGSTVHVRRWTPTFVGFTCYTYAVRTAQSALLRVRAGCSVRPCAVRV